MRRHHQGSPWRLGVTVVNVLGHCVIVKLVIIPNQVRSEEADQPRTCTNQTGCQQ